MLAARRRREAHPRRRRRRHRRQHRARPHGRRRRRARRPRRRRLRHPAVADPEPRCVVRRTRRALAPGRDGSRLLHQWRQRVRRIRPAPGPRLPRRLGPTGALEGHRPRPQLPRAHARRPGRRQSQRPSGRVRAAARRLPEGAVGRRRRRHRRDRARGRRHHRGVLVRADHGRRRRLPAAARRLLAGRRGRLPPQRHPAHRRRGDDRVRPHRAALGARPPADHTRRALRRQGARRRLRADRDGVGHGRGRGPPRGQRLHVLHVHRQRRDVRRRRSPCST